MIVKKKRVSNGSPPSQKNKRTDSQFLKVYNVEFQRLSAEITETKI